MARTFASFDVYGGDVITDGIPDGEMIPEAAAVWTRDVPLLPRERSLLHDLIVRDGIARGLPEGFARGVAMLFVSGGDVVGETGRHRPQHRREGSARCSSASRGVRLIDDQK